MGFDHRRDKEVSFSKIIPWEILPCYYNFPRGEEHPYSNACERPTSRRRWCLCTTKNRRGELSCSVDDGRTIKMEELLGKDFVLEES